MFPQKFELLVNEQSHFITYSILPQSKNEVLLLIEKVEPNIFKDCDHYNKIHYYPLSEKSQKVEMAYCDDDNINILRNEILLGIFKNEGKVI